MNVMKDLYIKDNADNLFFIPTKAGCEIWSDCRDMHVVISRTDVFDVRNNNHYQVYLVVYWLRGAQGWEKGNNAVSMPSIGEYMQRLVSVPAFSKAASEYRSKNNENQ